MSRSLAVVLDATPPTVTCTLNNTGEGDFTTTAFGARDNSVYLATPEGGPRLAPLDTPPLVLRTGLSVTWELPFRGNGVWGVDGVFARGTNHLVWRLNGAGDGAAAGQPGPVARRHRGASRR